MCTNVKRTKKRRDMSRFAILNLFLDSHKDFAFWQWAIFDPCDVVFDLPARKVDSSKINAIKDIQTHILSIAAVLKKLV